MPGKMRPATGAAAVFLAAAAACASTAAAAELRVDASGLSPSVTTFEGFGVSLCWWARGVGGWTNATAFDGLMDLLFDPAHPRGLGLNQVRYNVGGGTLGDTRLKSYRPGAWVPSFQPTPTAWDWSQDSTQRRVLTAALARGVRYAMAFSNSPPVWMTVSGSATGSPTGLTDNLKPTEFAAFAEYLANVTRHFRESFNVTFDSVTPLNEAANGWWRTGGSQEGCHFDQSSESKIIAELGAALRSSGGGAPRAGQSPTVVSGPEENSIDTSLQSLNKWSGDAVAAIGLITTHTYNGNNRAGLDAFAEAHGKRLWASEFGTGSGPLQGGLQLAQRIIEDLSQMRHLEVWTLWQAADLDNTLSPSGWGLTAASYCGCLGGQSCQCAAVEPEGKFFVRQQYYAMRQFSAFLRPGSTVLHPAATAARGETGGGGRGDDGGGRTSGSSLPDGVLLALAPNGTTLAFAVNAATVATPLSLTGLPGGGGGHGCAMHVLTDATHSTDVVAVIPVTNASMSALLPPESISTFVFHNECPPSPPAPAVRIRLRNATGLCVTGSASGAVELQTCASDASSQRWLLPAAGVGAVALAPPQASLPRAGRPGRSNSASGGAQSLCLSWQGQGKAVTLEARADGAAAQQWAWTGSPSAADGQLMAAGQGVKCDWVWGNDNCCLDDWGDSERPGDGLRTYSCWTGKNQQWVVETLS